MSSANNLDDEWVADLMSQEAAECALKYSSLGMDAYTKPAKRPANHPKPNTRFLNNIVKSTNNHNRNLLAQERADSKARLEDLDRAKRKADLREQRRQPGPADTRKRILGDIKAIIGGSSKKRKPDNEDRSKDAELDSKRLRRDGGDIQIRGRGQKREEQRDEDDLSNKNKNSRKELFADHGPKRGFARDDRDEDRRRSGERRHRHDRHDRGKTHTDMGTRNRSPRRSRAEHSAKDILLKEQPSDSDSDPLDDIIGPKPPSPVQRRGRGVASGSAAMDSRFESGYDPKGDVALDHGDDDDDWGSALEALRDRQRWKQQGAERLRAAGFTDEQVKKWEKGDQKNEDDVRWTKKGEQREWDRGKTLKDNI